MTGDTLELILGKLEGVSSRGSGWMARCPAHDDARASLSVAAGDTQPVVVKCQAGCATEEVLAAIGLTLADISTNAEASDRDRPEWTPNGPAVAIYDYTTEDGQLLFQVLRAANKKFSQRVPDPAARTGWRWKLGDVRRVPYRLPQLLAAVAGGVPVWIAEGEKDVQAIEAAGAVATCNPGGAGKWRAQYDAYLAGGEVTIVADTDEPGRKHALQVAAGLRPIARTVRVVEAREGKDAADHLAAGHSLDDFTLASFAVVDDDDLDDADDEPGRGPSQASRLVALARERYELVMSQDGRPYGVAKNGPNIAIPLRGHRGLRTWLAALYADVSRGATPSQSALADAMTVLEGFAARKQAAQVHLRLARDDDSVVIDLGTPDGRCVVVKPGAWHIAPRSPVLFRRTTLTSVIPDPIRGTDGLADLAGLLNAGQDAFRLLIGWMVSALIPEIPHPILAFKGEQGTGKTTAARCIVQAIDPSPAPLRTAPRDVRQWVTAAAASWAVCLDNVNAISSWLSETLCRAVTGDGSVDRALYTDDDVTVLAFRRVVMMTSIDAGQLDGDLAERLLLIELEPIDEGARRTDAELTAAYDRAQPFILAAILDLAAQVLMRLPESRPESMPRMADFACVLAALDKVQGWDTLGSYAAASDTIAADVLEGDPFGQAVIKLVRDQPGMRWLGTATDLLGLITPDKPVKNWPKDATRAGGRIKRIAPLLRQAGLSVDDSQRQPNGNRSRLYGFEVTLSESRSESAPAAPAAPEAQIDLPQSAGAETGAKDEAAPAAPAAVGRAGAPGATPGAATGTAPTTDAASDVPKQERPGAAGAAGADAVPISWTGICTVCETPLDAVYAELESTTHAGCGADESWPPTEPADDWQPR